ncbi:MAG TPA: hypothetical protein VFE90_20430 [Myxococcales bacterium]|jgi:hypothetical protein|nr:hypothetical protein [Myxococcales bacterium]
MRLFAATVAVVVSCAAQPVLAGEWTERFFGVGSDGNRVSACEQARDHAQGNSFHACMEKRGRRGDTSYTDCVCTQASEALHICNVNLKVSCFGTIASSGVSDSTGRRGAPKGRADRRRATSSGTRRAVYDRLGPEVMAERLAAN